MVKFKFVEENEASEPLPPTEANIPKEAIFELQEILPIKNIEIEKKVRVSNIVGYEYDIIPSIDFTALANTSDFKRLIYRAITGKVWRGTNSGLEKSLKSKLKKLKGSD